MGLTFDVRDPATGAVVGAVPEHGEADVAAMVVAASAAAAEWRRRPVSERIAVVEEGCRLVERHADELACEDAAGTGNPLRATRRDVATGVAGMRLMSRLVDQLSGRTLPPTPRLVDYIVREPYGVVARIIPFNHPVQFAVQKVAAPLLAGNCVILKPSPIGAVSAVHAAQLLAAVLPPDVLQVATDSDGAAGSALVRHPRVKRIAFTGSAPTAQRIMAEGAAHGIKSFSFELGGKNPLIVLPDADPEAAAAAAVAGMNLDRTLGQSCGSTSRVFVHEELYDDVVRRLVDKFESMRLGIPTDPETEYGCLSSPAQLQKVEHYVALGRREGATLAAGGCRPDEPRLAGGCFYRPTLFVDVDPRMRIANEEIFGPVLSVLRWRDEATMVDDVNRVEFGLTANIWTGDLAAGHRLASLVEAGYVWINSPDGAHVPGAPFGGVKSSGIGREASIEELESYTELKNVAVYVR
jgi:betaine-aldehyde dehydrogenase